MTNPPGHLWRDKWIALSGPLSTPYHKQGEKRCAAITWRFRESLMNNARWDRLAYTLKACTDLEPGTPALSTIYPTPYTLHLKSSLDSKLQTLNLQPQTLSPEP